MKKVLIAIFALFFIISMLTTVNAATADGSINVGASSESVIKGKTFTVTIAGTADNNIMGMEAKFNYDSSKLAIESKTAGNGFSDLSSNNEIAITTTSSENASKAGTLYTITFKVLDTALEGETDIDVKDAIIKVAKVENNVTSTEITEPMSGKVTVTIKADDTTADNKDNQNNVQEETKNNTTTPSNNTGSGNKSTGSSSSKNTTKKTTKLPQTGVESVSIIAIIALGIIGIASYVSYRKYKNI